jgi:hypothetical protein
LGGNLFEDYCDPAARGLGDDYGYAHSEVQGNAWEKEDLRGIFCRFGAQVAIKDVTDGLGNTIFVGEVLLAEHHEARGFNDWSLYPAQATGFTTVPINYPINPDDICQRIPGPLPTPSGLPSSEFTGNASPDHAFNNWAVADGFKSNHPAAPSSSSATAQFASWSKRSITGCTNCSDAAMTAR